MDYPKTDTFILGNDRCYRSSPTLKEFRIFLVLYEETLQLLRNTIALGTPEHTNKKELDAAQNRQCQN